MPTKVLVPPLGTTVDTVVLVSWYKNEGDTIAKGEPLFVIETDKANLDIEAPADGVLRQVSAQAGDEVKALSVIAWIAAPGESVAPTATAPKAQAQPSAPPAKAAPAGTAAAAPAAAPGGRQRIFISPRARRLAESEGVPWQSLPPTGPQGAIIERDVRAWLAAKPLAPAVTVPAPAPAPAIATAVAAAPLAREDNEPLETIPLRSIRAVIAERMLRSASNTAHVTVTAEADATELVALREQLVKGGLAVSYNDLLVYIVSRALRQHPQLNASLTPDSIQLWKQIHVGLAVDTDRGLLVPVVRDADRKTLRELADETRALIERARSGQSAPGELSGGTFTITNLGMFGIDAFTPIINLPECAVLGVGRIKRTPVMLGDAVVGRQMVWLSLTFDHRLVDGAPAARFMQRVVQLIERPQLLVGA